MVFLIPSSGQKDVCIVDEHRLHAFTLALPITIFSNVTSLIDQSTLRLLSITADAALAEKLQWYSINFNTSLCVFQVNYSLEFLKAVMNSLVVGFFLAIRASPWLLKLTVFPSGFDSQCYFSTNFRISTETQLTSFPSQIFFLQLIWHNAFWNDPRFWDGEEIHVSTYIYRCIGSPILAIPIHSVVTCLCSISCRKCISFFNPLLLLLFLSKKVWAPFTVMPSLPVAWTA